MLECHGRILECTAPILECPPRNRESHFYKNIEKTDLPEETGFMKDKVRKPRLPYFVRKFKTTTSQSGCFRKRSCVSSLSEENEACHSCSQFKLPVTA